MTNSNQSEQQNSTAAQVADGSAVQFSSGPFHSSPYSSIVGILITDKDEDKIAVVLPLLDDTKAKANAQLFTAAPRLYAALEALYNATPDNVGGMALGRACQEARAALAEARGEQNSEKVVTDLLNSLIGEPGAFGGNEESESEGER